MNRNYINLNSTHTDFSCLEVRMNRVCRSVSILVLACSIFLLRSAAAFSETVTILPTADATLIEESTGALANGADPNFFAGRTAQTVGDSVRRALIRFDIAAAIPSGAQVTSASLSLYMSKTRNSSQTMSLYRILSDWNEGTSAGSSAGGFAVAGDVTWLHTSFPSQFWGSAGGDYSPTVSASRSVSGIGFYQWGSTAQMVTDVQNWLDSPSTSHGWMLKGNEAASITSKRFESRESATAVRRPMLTINYTVPCTAEDANCDSVVNARDIQAFVDALATQVRCSSCAGDTDGDSDLDLNDVPSFVVALLAALRP